MLRQLNKINRITDTITKIDAMVDYALVIIYSDKAAALQLAHQALDLSTEFADSPEGKLRLARANSLCGYAQYLHYQMEPALRSASEALLYYQDQKLEIYTIDAMLTIAWVNIHAGELTLAAAYTNDALNIARILSDENRNARAFDALGIIYWLMGDAEKCNAAYAQAFKHAQAHNDPQVVMILKNNYANTLKGFGDLAQAESFAQQSLALAKSMNLIDETLIFTCTLANVYTHSGRAQLASQALQEAEILLPAGMTTIPYIYLLLERTDLLMAGQEYKKAIEVAETGLAAAKATHADQNVADFLQKISDSYSALGDHKQAFEAQKVLLQAQNKLNQMNFDLRLNLFAVEKQIELFNQKKELSLLASSLPANQPSEPQSDSPKTDQTYRWIAAFPSILIMDPDEVSLQGLKSLFAQSNAMVTAATTSAREAVILAGSQEPAMLLCEWVDGEDDTLSMLQKIRTRFPELPIVLYTHQLHPEITASAEANRVNGYYLKGGTFKHLLSYLNKVYNGEASLDTLSLRRLIRNNEPDTELASISNRLTYRQQAIADLLSKGYLYRNIAQMLHLSERTIKRESKMMMQELGLKNRNTMERYFRSEKQ